MLILAPRVVYERLKTAEDFSYLDSNNCPGLPKRPTSEARRLPRGRLSAMSATPAPPPLAPPEAPRRPHVVSAHGDDREDLWFWLRDREDPAVLEYLRAENDYTDATLAPLDALRTELFEEMKARIKETDMTVPARRGPWWYFTRTEEGKDYAIHCRRPAHSAGELPPASEPGDEEQIVLDENVLAAAPAPITSPWGRPR